MRVMVTGGAGFIGSCMVRALNDMGIEDIVVVDNIGKSEKWMNLREKKYTEYIPKSELPQKLSSLSMTHIIHMGACSATTETDFDYLYSNNFEFSKLLWNYAKDRRCSFIYASSAATYGDGEQGFDDKLEIDDLDPLNRYGYSKQLFDLWAKKQIHSKNTPKQHVGLKFFNVFGPNEYHKGSMASMVYHGFRQIQEGGKIRLFRSHRPDYADGEQLRDFIYVKDVCAIIRWFLDNPLQSGLFNAGTGGAHSFRQLAEATFSALDKESNIIFIDMPSKLQGKYQYFTEASMAKLQETGCNIPFTPLEEAVRDYVQGYLARDYAHY